MRKLIAIILLLFTVGLNAQTIKSNFAGYGNLRSSTGTTGPTYTFVIDGFVGNTRFQVDGPFPGTDVAIGDVVWGDCARFVIDSILSSGYSTMTVRVKVPTVDQSLGVAKPPDNSRIAIVREFEGIFPSLPPIADGNAGALSGIEATLWTCMDNHYSTQMFTTVNTVNELVEYVGGEDVAPAVPASSYAGQKWTNSQGQIYRSNGSVWLKMGDEDIYTVRQFARARNISTEASFNALKSYFATRGGNIIVDTTVTFTTNNTVANNVNVQMVKGGRFIIPNATTLTINSPFSSHPSQHCFSWTGTGTVLFAQSSVATIWPYWFGAKNDGATDCQPPIQKSIDVAIASKILDVKLLSGYHILEKGVVIKKVGAFVTLTLEGQKAYDGDNGTNIICRDTSSFGIGIQGARAVIIKNLLLFGRNSSYNPSFSQVVNNTKQDWRNAWGRSSRYSPYAGIVIEPFSNTVPADGGYPGFTSEYVTGNVWSSDIVIENVITRYFIAGVAITPSGTVGNGAEIRINKCLFDRTQYGVAVGQNQSRQVDITETTISTNEVCLDGQTFGDRTGIMPNVTNSQLGYCKDIFRFDATRGNGKMVNVYGEGIYRLGSWQGTGDVLMFVGCEFALVPCNSFGVKNPASILDSQSPIDFTGGSIIEFDQRLIEVNCSQKVKFKGSRLSSLVANNPNGNYPGNIISYDNVNLTGYNGETNGQFLSDLVESPSFGALPISLALPGFKTTYAEIGTNNKNMAVLEDAEAGNQHFMQTLENANVIVNTTLNTAKWYTARPGKYRLGDNIISYNSNSSASPQNLVKTSTFGVVTSIVGDTITCSFTTNGITSGSYLLYLYSPKKVIPTHIANITAGSNKVVVTSKSTGRGVVSLWPSGTRIYCDASDINYAIPTGYYVTSVVADTIFLSGTAVTTLTGIEIYSAPTKTSYYSYDNTYQTSLSGQRNVGYRTGDRIEFKSHPYIESAIVTKGGFTPDLKFNFKTISGTTGARPTPTAQESGLEYYNTTLGVKQYWTGSAWVEMGVIVSARLSGAGTIASPLDLASQGATSGQVLKFNGTNWIPGTDNSGGGATIDSVFFRADTIGAWIKVNNVTSTKTEISTKALAQTNAQTGNMLWWDGVDWQPTRNANGNLRLVESGTGNTQFQWAPTGTNKTFSIGVSGATTNLSLSSSDSLLLNGSAGGVIIGTATTSFGFNSLNTVPINDTVTNIIGVNPTTRKLSRITKLDSTHVKDFGLSLQDLSVTGATTGQGIRYNGIRWIPSTFLDRNIFEQSGWLTSARQLSLKGNTFTFAGDSSANNTLVRIQSTRPAAGTNPLVLSSPNGDLTTTFQSGPLGSFVMNYSSGLTNREFRISTGGTGMNLNLTTGDSLQLVAGNRIVLDANNGVVAGNSSVFPVNQSLTNLLGYNTSTRRLERINGIDSSQFALGIIPLDRIAQSGASSGQVPQWNGSKWVPSNSVASLDTLANYTALRAYTGSGNAVVLQDYSAVIGGVFTRVSNGTENGGTLIVASNGTKWKRQFDGVTFYPEYWEIGGYDERGVSGGITDVTEKIQAAINMATLVGGSVILQKKFSPYNVIGKVPNITIGSGSKGCIDLKSNIRFIIEVGAILQKESGAQTNASGALSVIYGDTISNVYIGGGGSILGNTAGQPGWTLGYSQAGAYGSGIFIAQNNATVGRINSNITISDIKIIDHFSTSSEIIGVDNLVIENYYWSATGEGFELQRCYDVMISNIIGLGTGVEVGDGFETAGCVNVNATNVTIKNWNAGTYFDIYATKKCNIDNFILIGTGTQGGISMGSASGPIISEDLTFSNGYVYGMGNGAYCEDGDVRYSNITFDSCGLGIQLTNGANPAIAATKEAVIEGCTFKNRTGGTGVLFDTNKRGFVSNCVFDGLNVGVSIVGNASTLKPKAFITGCVFNKIGANAVWFNDQGQPLFAAESLVSGCTFKGIAGHTVTLSGNTSRIRVADITLDSIYVLTSSTNSVSSNFMYVTALTSSTVSTLPAGTDGQVLTLATNMPAGNTKTIVEGGNILLQGKSAFTMVQACQISFIYSHSLSKWVETSRTQAGNINDLTSAVLERKYFLSDWAIENVGASSQTNVVVARLGTTTTYGKDFYVPVDAMVRRFGIISNTAISTGSVTANLMFSGTGPNGTVTLSGGQTNNITSYGRYGKSFGAGTFLGVTFTTSATFNHPNADILIWMEIEY